MASTLFAENLKSSLDVPSINRYFVENRQKTLQVLHQLRPEGRVDGGRFKLASLEGGAGGSFDYNLQNGHWGDWAAGDARHGLVGFVEATMKCSSAQAVDFLIKEKFLDKKEAKKALAESEGDPLVLPIPEHMQPWEVALEADCVRKDRGLIREHWTYRDLDGSLLGYMYRVDSRNTNKEVYTLTYRAEGGWSKKAWQKGLIPPYGLETLRDGPTVRVLFVEGEKARDKAVELLGDRWKVLSFSGVKGSDQLWLPDEEFWTDAEIVLWPDNDGPGKEAARKIQLAIDALTNKPRETRIVRTDQNPNITQGWDIGDWTEDCGVDLSVELERAELLDSFDRISREWVYVAQEDKFYNLDDRQLILSPAAFDRTFTRYGSKAGTPSKLFLSSLETSKAVDLDFLPGHETFITTPSGKLLLNEWFPSEAYARGREIAEDDRITDEEILEKAQCFVRHLDRISANQLVEPEKNVDGIIIPGTEKRLLRDALSHFFSLAVRRPMDKQGWVPILVSEHNGTGKSYFRRVMAEILGGKRVQELTIKQYLSDYEDWMDGCLFYELNEAKSQQDSEVYDLLKRNHSYKPFNPKDLRDRSQGVRQVNIKGSKQKQQRNFMNAYITSNDLYPLALANTSGLDGSDRRLLAVNCEEIIPEHEADAMFDELRDRPEWVAAWLMRYRSPVPWNPGWAPITEHKRKMLEKDRERSENRADKYELGKFDEFYHLIRWAREDRFALFRRKVVTADGIRSLCEDRRVKFPWDPTRFEKILEKAGLVKGPAVTMDNQLRKTYAVVPEMVGKPVAEWKKELLASINGPLEPQEKKSKDPVSEEGPIEYF